MSKHFKKPITPAGPTADTRARASTGMKAAMRAMGAPTEQPKVEGKLITQRPLPAPTLPPKQPAPPPPQSQNSVPAAPVKPEVDPRLAMGQPHVSSYQSLLSNDKLAKPTIKAWGADKK